MLPPIKITFTLNDEERTLEVNPVETATLVLRETLGLTGTKLDCAEGECGSCTVIFNGQPACSCLMTAAQMDGAEIVSVEGIAPSGTEHADIQRAFVEEGAVQCGHCIPGMIVAGAALLERNASPTEDEVRWAISGNICRCTGYAKIVTAILRAAQMRRESLPTA